MNYFNEIIQHLGKLFQWWIIVLPWERGIRVRFGNRIKVLADGTHFRIPFFDTVYIQTTRLRVVSMPLQTMTTRDKRTLTIIAVVGYSISDILMLYNRLFQPESTISNMVLSKVSEYIATHSLEECTPSLIEMSVQEKLASEDYGIKYEYVKIIGYAEVRTFRLIQDQHWTPDNLSMTDRK